MVTQKPLRRPRAGIFSATFNAASGTVGPCAGFGETTLCSWPLGVTHADFTLPQDSPAPGAGTLTFSDAATWGENLNDGNTGAHARNTRQPCSPTKKQIS
jgi:hypothetical protein